MEVFHAYTYQISNRIGPTRSPGRKKGESMGGKPRLQRGRQDTVQEWFKGRCQTGGEEEHVTVGEVIQVEKDSSGRKPSRGEQRVRC